MADAASALFGLLFLLGAPIHGDRAATFAAAAEPSLTAAAPASCADAKQRAREKQDDGVAKSISVQKSGTLDECFGAVLLPGRAPSGNVRDYACTGREGVASLGEGVITLITRPSSGVPEGRCNVRLVGDASGKVPEGVDLGESDGLKEMSVREASELARVHLNASVPMNANDIVQDAFSTLDEAHTSERLDPNSMRNNPDATWALIQYADRGAKPLQYDSSISEKLRSSDTYQELIRISDFGAQSSLQQSGGAQTAENLVPRTLFDSEHTFSPDVDRWARLPQSDNIEDRRAGSYWQQLTQLDRPLTQGFDFTLSWLNARLRSFITP